MLKDPLRRALILTHDTLFLRSGSIPLLLTIYMRVLVKRIKSTTPDGYADSPDSLRTFWRTYFLLCDDLDDFLNDYCKACSKWLMWEMMPSNLRGSSLHNQQSSECWSFFIFLERGYKVEVPCPKDPDDKAFLAHLRGFWNLTRFKKGLIDFWSLRVLGRVEISQVRMNPDLWMQII